MLGKLRLRQKDGFLIKERVDKQQQQKYVQVITHEYYKRPFPVNTGRKLNEHKSFRRRPGRLLNDLCTFNLCPVSMGLTLYTV